MILLFDKIIEAIINNIVFIITLVLSFITIYLTYKIFKLEKFTAIKKGAFRSPNLIFGTYNTDSRDQSDLIPDYFIVACKISQNAILQFPLKFSIRNKGDKSANKVKIALRFPKSLRAIGFLELDMENENNISKEYAPKLTEDFSYQTATYDIGTIHPEQGFRFEDWIFISNSNFNVDSVSKNVNSSIVKFKKNWHESIDYAVYQEDAEPILSEIEIHFIDITEHSLKNILDCYNIEIVENYNKKVKNLIQHILYCRKLNSIGKKTLKNIQLITYDESKVKRYQKIIDQVPYKALIYYYGIEDVRGAISIPEINGIA